MSLPLLAARCAVTLIALVAAAGCSSESNTPAATPTINPSQSPSPPPTVAPPRPPKAACYRLSIAEALAPTNLSPTVPCRRKWTSRTFHVGTLDLVSTDGHLLAVDSMSAQSQVARECPERLAKFLGGTTQSQRLSVLRSTWFTPTLTEAEAGANWFRCDVVSPSGQNSLARLTGPLRNALGIENAAYALCGTAKPGSPGFDRVACSRDHSWQAVKAIDLSGKTYPGTKRAQALGVTPCTDAAREEAQDALNFQWGYEWPTKEQWDGADGQPPQRYGICWAPADGS